MSEFYIIPGIKHGTLVHSYSGSLPELPPDYGSYASGSCIPINHSHNSNLPMFFSLKQRFPVGARYMLLSALGFASMTVCVRQASTNGIPVFEIVAARALVSLVLSFLDIKRKGLPVWGNNRPLLVARGCVGAVALICVYFSVVNLPLAEATIIQYTHPVFTALLAFLVLRERIQPTTMVCILLSLTGLYLMVRPGAQVAADTGLPLFSVALALTGAFFSAIAYIIVKRLSRTEDSSVIIFYFPLVALPVSLILLGDNFVMPDLQTALLLILLGVFTQVGQVGLTRAMQTETASRATAYSYVQVLASILMGWVFFSEVPSLWTWLGGGLIMAGALVNVYGSIVSGKLNPARV